MKKGFIAKLLVVTALLTLVAATGCLRGDSDKEYGGRGKIIHVGALEPKKFDKVVYALPRFCEGSEASGQPGASSERDALAALYNATGGPDWKNSENWLSGEPLDDWYGIVADADGSVTGIYLGENGLDGMLPSELGALSRLAALSLSGNGDLSGCVPASLDGVTFIDFHDVGLEKDHYAIAPQVGGHVIAAVWARVLNPGSTQVALSVDGAASTLRDLNEIQYNMIDPSPGEGAVKTQEEAPDDNPYFRRLWGQYQVIAGFEIPGWLFFEVPAPLEFSALVWEDVEFVRVRYPTE